MALKINIGGQKGGDRFPKDWKMVDVRKGADYIVDIMEKRLPFKNDTVDAIYTSHTLEHILPHKTSFVLKEMKRVLKKGSKLRVVVPDIDIAIKAYVDKNYDFLKKGSNPTKMDWLPSLPINYLYCWFHTHSVKDGKVRMLGGHVNAFNAELMDYYLTDAGFKDVKRKKFNDCDDIFENCDFPRYKDCSLYMEGSV